MNYKLIGRRNLRKYTAPQLSPTYAASVDARLIVDSLCGLPWTKVAAKDATMTYHTEEIVAEADGQKIGGLEMNVRIRDQFDAAMFCADHVGGQHRAYANAAVYHYILPSGTLPKLTRLVAKVTSDPYNSAGARIAILTNATGAIPTSCNDCRTGDAHADGVAPRTVAANGNWFPTMADCVFSADPGDGETALPSGGLQLQKHLFVFVLMESYSTVRGNWIEGCSFIRNLIEIETDAEIPGWADGAECDCTGDVRGFGFLDVSNMGFTRLFSMSGPARWVGKKSLTKNNVTHDFIMVCGEFADGDSVSMRDFVLYDLTADKIIDLSGLLSANPNLARAYDLGWKLFSVYAYESSARDFVLAFNFDHSDNYNGKIFQGQFNVNLGSGACESVVSFADIDLQGSASRVIEPCSENVRVDRDNGIVVTIGYDKAVIAGSHDEQRIAIGSGLERADHFVRRIDGPYDYSVIAYGSFDSVGDVETGNVARIVKSFVNGESGKVYSTEISSLFGSLKVRVDNCDGLTAFKLSDPVSAPGLVESWLLIGAFKKINGLACENAAIINVFEATDEADFNSGDARSVIPLSMPQFGAALAEIEKMSYGRITLSSPGSVGRIYFKA